MEVANADSAAEPRSVLETQWARGSFDRLAALLCAIKKICRPICRQSGSTLIMPVIQSLPQR